MRGLLRNGTVVVLDEPLAGLDASTRVKVMRIIKDKCSGKTTLVITHDKEIIPYMDRVVNISEINKSVNHVKTSPPTDSIMETFMNWIA